MKDVIKEQHKKKKYHAIERIGLLVDPGTFREMGSKRMNLHTGFGEPFSVDYDGVIAGRANIKGKGVFIFSQDFTVKGGTIGKVHGEKIAHIIRMAIDNRSPIVGIYDSGGARIEEGIHALAGCGEILHANSLASGVIPQISIIVGPCAGAAAYSPALTDFVFIVKKIGYMFITGSNVVQSVTGEVCDNESLGGAKIHSTKSGVADFFEDNEKKCFDEVRRLIDFIPSGYDRLVRWQKTGFEEKDQSKIKKILPSNSQKAYDIKDIIDEIVDQDSFIEVSKEFSPSIVVGFSRISSIPVGIVANQPMVNSGVLDHETSDKAARFIRFCDCYSIPILTLVDTPGYLPGVEQEHQGIIRHGAKLIYAYSEATVPKITIVLRKAYGGAYIAMGSKHLNTDYNYTLKIGEIAVMGAEGAVGILHKKKAGEFEEEEARKSFLKRKLEEYKKDFMNPRVALEAGYIDEIIKAEDIRRRVYEDLMSLEFKKQRNFPKKHGNMPL